MQKIKFIFTLITMLVIFACMPAQAYDSLELAIDSIINNSSLSNTSIISVSIRDAQSGNIVYQKNADLFLRPASTLKAFTTPVILYSLGKDYKLTTSLYKSDNTYLKLSGDPFLTSNDLYALFKDAKISGLNIIQGPIIIDDSIIDSIPLGKGWMWDDQDDVSMPKFNAYNLDHNIVTVKVIPKTANTHPEVIINPSYPVKIINEAETANINTLKVEKRTYLNPDDIYVTGKVASPVAVKMPVGTPQKYFISRLQDIVRANSIEFSGDIKTGVISPDGVLISSIEHNIVDEIKETNHKSDNMAVETLFKITGSKFTNSQGTTEKGFLAFKKFYKDLGIDSSSQKLVDASGVSFYNLMQTSWMTLALSKIYNMTDSEVFISTLAVPGQSGTLENRLIGLKDRVKAKTGTLSGVSGIVGYINSLSGKNYTFAILIQNYKGNSSSAKALEDKIIETLFNY